MLANPLQLCHAHVPSPHGRQKYHCSGENTCQTRTRLLLHKISSAERYSSETTDVLPCEVKLLNHHIMGNKQKMELIFILTWGYVLHLKFRARRRINNLTFLMSELKSCRHVVMSRSSCVISTRLEEIKVQWFIFMFSGVSLWVLVCFIRNRHHTRSSASCFISFSVPWCHFD